MPIDVRPIDVRPIDVRPDENPGPDPSFWWIYGPGFVILVFAILHLTGLRE
jgi:hypothetical protein